MTRTAADQQAIDQHHPLMMLPEQRLIDAMCVLANRYVARSAAVAPDSMDHLRLSDRIDALVALVDELGMSDEFRALLLAASDAALFGKSLVPVSFSLLADDEECNE